MIMLNILSETPYSQHTLKRTPITACPHSQNLVDPLREQSSTTAKDLYSDARFHLYLTCSILEQMIIHVLSMHVNIIDIGLSVYIRLSAENRSLKQGRITSLGEMADEVLRL